MCILLTACPNKEILKHFPEKIKLRVRMKEKSEKEREQMLSEASFIWFAAIKLNSL